MRFDVRLWLVFTVAFLLLTAPASAHGYILRSIPEDRAVLDRPPVRLQYWFSEDLEPDYSYIRLRNADGELIAEGSVAEDNYALMMLRVPPELPDGAYLAELRLAFASDGHVITEMRAFFVGQEVGGVGGGASGYDVQPLEVVWRVLLLASTVLLFGAYVVYTYVLVPAWGSDQHAAGRLPARVMRRLNVVIIAALAVAFGANALALVQQAMVFFNTDMGDVLARGLWGVVRVSSRFGDVWNGRMFLLVLVALLHGGSLYLWTRQPRFVQAFWSANVWAAALVLGTFSITAHAAGSLLWPWAAVVMDWLHTLAVGAWAGGLAALVLVLPAALKPYAEDARRQALLAVLRRFSRLAVAAVGVVIATGVYSASNWIYTPSDLTQTAWGGALLIKVGMVALLLALGAAHHMAANPERFTRWSGRVGRLGALALTLRLEAVLALVVLGAVALLSATPVPEPDFLSNSPPAPSATQTAGEYTVSMTLLPGGPGINTYDTVLLRDGVPVTEADVRLQWANPARDWRGGWQQAELVDSGLYVTAGAEIDRAGGWWALLDITPPEGETTRAAFEWAISEEGAVVQSRDPGWVHLAALAGVGLALLYAALPALRRLYHWLDWNPASVTAAVSAVLALVIFTALAVLLAQQGTADYEAMVNPLPQMVNPALPDGESLATGEALYTAHCPGWEARTMTQMAERLPSLRDEALYQITENGWQNLPPCDDMLEDEQRWHIVNYLRAVLSNT